MVPSSTSGDSEDTAQTGYYALATTHAALERSPNSPGCILLAAGTDVAGEIPSPSTSSMQRFGLWWLELLLGLATYARWYVPHLFPE
jgi:hypothetical protein